MTTDSAEAARGLRLQMLSFSPSENGIKPTKEFPRVFGVLMDWPIGEYVATVFSAFNGDASLYTTSGFGILGGGGHEIVRIAARNFVRFTDQFFHEASPTTNYPYPSANRVRFYLLTFDGVRVIQADMEAIENGTSKYTELFGCGQAVITGLRQISEKRQ